MPRFSVGEFAIKKGESDFLFRPSFSALDKIGDSKEIMQAFVDLQLANPERPKWHEISLSLDVMQACCNQKLDDCFGYMIESKGKPKFKFKGVPAHDLIVFARHLIVSGVYGKPYRKPDSSDNQESEFKPIEFVSFAVEHLNVSISEAWDLTMIEFQRLHDSKFPQDNKEKSKGMTVGEMDALEEAIKKKRAK